MPIIYKTFYSAYSASLLAPIAIQGHRAFEGAV